MPRKSNPVAGITVGRMGQTYVAATPDGGYHRFKTVKAAVMYACKNADDVYIDDGMEGWEIRIGILVRNKFRGAALFRSPQSACKAARIHAADVG